MRVVMMLAIVAMLLVGCGNSKEDIKTEEETHTVETNDIAVTQDCDVNFFLHRKCSAVVTFLGKDGIPLKAKIKEIKYTLSDEDMYIVEYKGSGKSITATLKARQSDYDPKGQEAHKYFKISARDFYDRYGY